MKMLVAFFGALLLVGAAQAQGAYNIAKQQAKNAAAREAQNQQAINPTPPPAPATPPPAQPQPNPVLEATLKNIANLRFDFQKLDSSPTNKQPLINDLTAAAQGAKASPASVSKLAEDLAAAIAGNKKLANQHQKLAQNLHAIFNSSHLSPSQQQMIFDGVQKILLDGGVSSDDTAKVVSSLKTIANETK